MPLRTPNVTDQDDVTYRNAAGETYQARVLGATSRLAAPGAPTVTPQGTIGTTTYRYQVTAVDADSVESPASVGGQTTTGNAVLSATNFNRVTWVAVADAVTYKVYGRTGADGTLGLLGSTATTTYDDTGTPAPGATPTSPEAGSLRLRIWYGTKDVIKNGVRKATGMKQTDRYFYR